MTWSPLRELTTEEAADALRQASSHVSRQQHEGTHEQSRYDAMLWCETYATHGRCKCAKCEREWKKGNPS